MVAEQRLRKKLRDEQGQIYSIHVSAQQSRVPRHFSLNIEFGCDPDLAEDILNEAQAELNNFVDEPISEKEFDLAKSQVIRSLEVQEQSNSAWLRRLVGAYQFTGSPHWAFDSYKRVENSSIEAVMKLIVPLLKSDNVLTMCLKPKP
jgi:zinc protease